MRLEPFGLTVAAVAVVLNESRKTFSTLVNGGADVGQEVAICLSVAFGPALRSG